MFSYYTIRGIRIVIGIIALSFLLFVDSAGAAISNTSSYRTYAPGDLILSEDRVYLPLYEGICVSWVCPKNMILLKEGLSPMTSSHCFCVTSCLPR